jgi:predicted dehydrogenase
MGSRHVSGYAALQRIGLSNVDLVAVCDIKLENAESVARQAEELLGKKPTVYQSIDDAIKDPAIHAFDIVTEAFSHLEVALPALRAGKHVLCEKPMALTVRSCQAMIEAARSTNSVLAVAENYRRDPPNRLVKALIEAGLLGHLHLLNQSFIGGDDHIIITPWRHQKHRGSIALDICCHYTDIVQYHLGEIESVYGESFIAEPVRRRRETPEMDLPSYWARLKQMPEKIVPDCEDSAIGFFQLASGAKSTLSYIPSGPGKREFQRSFHGRAGHLTMEKDRTGGIVEFTGEKGAIRTDELQRLIPSFELDEVTSRLFDGKVSYTLPFAQSDAALMAIEIYDFADAILTNRKPEVDGEQGMKAVAAVLGIFESSAIKRPVTMEEILTSKVSAYQDSIDEELGLLK